MEIRNKHLNDVTCDQKHSLIGRSHTLESRLELVMDFHRRRRPRHRYRYRRHL